MAKYVLIVLGLIGLAALPQLGGGGCGPDCDGASGCSRYMSAGIGR